MTSAAVAHHGSEAAASVGSPLPANHSIVAAIDSRNAWANSAPKEATSTTANTTRAAAWRLAVAT